MLGNCGCVGRDDDPGPRPVLVEEKLEAPWYEVWDPALVGVSWVRPEPVSGWESSLAGGERRCHSRRRRRVLSPQPRGRSCRAVGKYQLAR